LRVEAVFAEAVCQWLIGAADAIAKSKPTAHIQRDRFIRHSSYGVAYRLSCYPIRRGENRNFARTSLSRTSLSEVHSQRMLAYRSRSRFFLNLPTDVCGIS